MGLNRSDFRRWFENYFNIVVKNIKQFINIT